MAGSAEDAKSVGSSDAKLYCVCGPKTQKVFASEDFAFLTQNLCFALSADPSEDPVGIKKHLCLA